ncbi:histidinol phosphatase [Flavobacterium cyanobacteriorum]|uniref:protein-tyrosine-phosphatase n=1 Tax=Flavobacterium cyanobacteriorum TaxID=2022802 RepID=A0A255YU02_9FLAO|nr:CpsB/CapC family capsule biosynthesis tyrosine phosphatase [Flavobacterium cyanobacteriorum]OYQ32125.1 histidinol phosphatase [Flavobacterium cyanobacteriorum]
MLFFSKPKPVLADLIPDNYTDIHSHLLPGIDDGAKDIDDTRSLLGSLRELGFSRFITTPHILTGVWNNTREGITALEQDILLSFGEGVSGATFKAAAEYFMDDTFFNLIKEEPLLTLKDNYVLVEMSYLNPPLPLYDILYELRLRDYVPVLAHPERYVFYHGNMEYYKKLKKAGCLLQLNLLSVTGYYGKGVAEAATALLEAGMIDFTGSDVHHNRHAASFKNKVVLKKTDALERAISNNSVFSW